MNKSKVDAIIFSPPYAEAQNGGGIAKKGYQGNKHSETDLIGKRSYMPSNIGDKENISNKPYGEIDAIVFSPPYAKVDHSEIPYSKCIKQKGYSQNPKNIGNLHVGSTSNEVEEEQVENVLFFKPTPGFQGYEQFFHSESVTHPAKANLNMLRWIIERYTQEGDLILDPMAGTGSTGIIACYLKRKAVLIDLEQKFVDMMKRNIQRFRNACKFWKVNRPEPVAMQGDSRQLSEVLTKVDSIIFSPPYSETYSKDAGGGNKAYAKGKPPRIFKEKKLADAYSMNKENIGNLPHGEIDAIITSPPYEASISSGQENFAWVGKRGFDPKEMELMRKTGLKRYREIRENSGYSKNKENIGILSKETYLSAMLKVYRECWKVLKSNGKMVVIIKNFIRNKKIVRVDLDTIKLCEKVGFRLVEKWYSQLKQQSFWRTIYYQKYPYAPKIKYEHILVFEKCD